MNYKYKLLLRKWWCCCWWWWWSDDDEHNESVAFVSSSSSSSSSSSLSITCLRTSFGPCAMKKPTWPCWISKLLPGFTRNLPPWSFGQLTATSKIPNSVKHKLQSVRNTVAAKFHKWLNRGRLQDPSICYSFGTIALAEPLSHIISRYTSCHGKPRTLSYLYPREWIQSSSSSSCGLSRGGRCRSYELAPCLSILRSVTGGC